MFTPPEHTALTPERTTRAMIDAGHAAAISGAQLRIIREAWGMSAKDLAHSLGIGLRTIQRYEATHAPAWVAIEIDFIQNETLAWLEALNEAVEAVPVWHDGWHVIQTGKLLPASWWRATVGHATHTNPMLAVEWAD